MAMSLRSSDKVVRPVIRERQALLVSAAAYRNPVGSPTGPVDEANSPHAAVKAGGLNSRAKRLFDARFRRRRGHFSLTSPESKVRPMIEWLPSTQGKQRPCASEYPRKSRRMSIAWA